VVDLGAGRSLLASHYTLRHGFSSTNVALRNWNFEGSNDAKSWTVLSEHRNDTHLGDNYKSHTWQVGTEFSNDVQPYRYFSIHVTGYNASRHYYLQINAIELYGRFLSPSVV
jgi:hypothetical protein